MKNTEHAGFHSTAIAAVNEALVVLGQDVTIDELSTTSRVVHARKAAFLYEGSRIRVLRDHTWAFAKREIVVDGCAGADDLFHVNGPREFPWRFARPTRCARVVACFDRSGRIVHHRLSGAEIQAQTPVAKLSYIEDIHDLDKWSPDAYHALVLRLAADLAKPITGRINERQLQEQAYADALANAKLNDARETNTPYDAYGSNYAADVMRGAMPRARDPFRSI